MIENAIQITNGVFRVLLDFFSTLHQMNMNPLISVLAKDVYRNIPKKDS